MSISVSFLITLVEFFVVLGLLLFFHEFGHFIVSRLLKVEVEEFGFGFPPRLVKLFRIGKTDFTLNLIPFGAFVRPKGENDPNVPGGLASASPWTRLAVLLGGPFMNVLVGLIIFSVMFVRIGAPITNVVQVIEVAASTPAATAGFKPGDVIQSVNGQAITSTQGLQTAIQNNLGKTVEVVIQRDGQTSTLNVTPRLNPPKGQGPLGIVMGNPYKPVPIYQALPEAGSMAYQQAYQLLLLPVHLIEGQANPSDTRIVGPVGMFDIYSQAVQLDSAATSTPIQQPAVNVLYFIGTISVALGLTNLLPIPALDGGRILFVLPELILRKRVPAQYENFVHLIGFAALLLLMSYITLQDVMHPIVMP
ncbi:MAG: M50 family metallopeptidase [Chloroflexi bacterium]|nr:M50 family metallopeptidase [Chloroflexota bacterium]